MYELFLLPPAQKDLDKLEAPAFARIIKKLRALSEDARPSGCLKLTVEDGYRIRIGEYRILYRIDDPSKRIFVYRIKHRKDVYS
ncbi:MAG TPA: type II toxin-antitoxin system RelE/ParE family toxin [Candidatus Latescibacteria bacterium]|nr:type II toxin-antitoxin system RelE/ParE family toxin [Candidatus Latescibacterota bacterium]